MNIKFRRAHFGYDGKFLQFSYWGPMEGGFKGWMNMNVENVRLAIDEQFTGLQDSKGVDIYEGDVLRGKFSDWIVLGLGWDSEGKYGMTLKTTKQGKSIYMADSSFLSSEVIGNVHEKEDSK